MPSVIELPKKKVAPVRISPKRFLMYSMPKVGKTDMLSQLPSCLILDADPDQGAGLYECLRYEITRAKDVYDVIEAIEEEGGSRLAKGLKDLDLFPYRFLAMDPISEFETFCERLATEKFRKNPLNANGFFEKKGYTSVKQLPDGAGYPYLWNELTEMCNALARRCTNLIITAHVREKYMGGKDEKEDVQAVVNDIDLTGKLSSIMCAAVDAIGYVYRDDSKDNKGTLMISFQTNDKAVMGARQKYLAGQRMPFSWERIYPDIVERDEEGKYRLVGQKEVGV